MGAASMGVFMRVLALAALAMTACSPRPKAVEGPLNLVLVTIDTLRADRLGCYGYAKAATPNLDRLAREGALFENAATHAPLTAPSHASLFTGVYPTVHKVRDTGGFVLAPSATTLAEVLEQKGYDTAAFVGASVVKRSFGLAQGFGVYDDTMPKPDAALAVEFPERRAGEVVDRAVEWLGSQSGKPYFLWVHVFDPHDPYDPPEPFRERFKDAPYDGEVAYTDRELGRLFDAAAKKSKENTIIAVLSDHGESLGDHGEYTHGVFLYDATMRVPLIIAGPGAPAGARVKSQARVVDVLPTLLGLMNVAAPDGVQGTRLASDGRSAGESYGETLFSRINMGWSELRSIRTDRWKYIRAPRPELYDLQRDPGERSNVIASHADVARELSARLDAIAGGAEKVKPSMADRKTLQQLRSLGYMGGASGGEITLGGGGVDPKDRLEVLKLLHEGASPGANRAVALRRALALDPGNPTIYYHLGLALAPPEALKLYQDAVRRGVRAAWLDSRLGHLYIRQGDRARAIAAFERAAQLNPSDCESLSDLGLAYLESDRLADAERVYKWCLATGEDFPLAHNGMGLALVRRDDFAGARKHFEKAVAGDPKLMEARLNLGRIYKILGDMPRARATFQSFLAEASPAEYGEVMARIRAELVQMK
jgi:choline-sulfatase